MNVFLVCAILNRLLNNDKLSDLGKSLLHPTLKLGSTTAGSGLVDEYWQLRKNADQKLRDGQLLEAYRLFRQCLMRLNRYFYIV